MLWPKHQKHIVTKIHQEKGVEAKSGPESATGDISSRHLFWSLPLFPYFHLSLLPSSSSAGLPGILVINV